jgi:hypothetical protein
MSKHIYFNPASATSFYDSPQAVPATSVVPSWYKQIPPERGDGTSKTRRSATVKKCLPFLDAITSGYVFCLPYDLLIEKKDGEVMLRWFTDTDNIEVEQPYRVEGIPNPMGFYPTVWRFNSLPNISTPKGYSCLITHPFNRYDLPFLAMTGVVDTDQGLSTSAIVFYLNEGFEGIIEKGTPLAQILPFKRDDWEHILEKPRTPEEEKAIWFKLTSKIDRSYLRQFWNRKSYK